MAKAVLDINGVPPSIHNAHTRVKRPPSFVQQLSRRKSRFNSIKINVDGAYSTTTHVASIVVIARDHDGFVLARLAKRIDGLLL
ncbi:hypothetical protein V6N11_084165 [Hibiscus sabdariffa]